MRPSSLSVGGDAPSGFAVSEPRSAADAHELQVVAARPMETHSCANVIQVTHACVVECVDASEA